MRDDIHHYTDVEERRDPRVGLYGPHSGGYLKQYRGKCKTCGWCGRWLIYRSAAVSDADEHAIAMADSMP